MARVVIIDDEASILELMSQLCKSLGHNVTVRQSGAEGMLLVAESRPDLLIVDLHIGDTSGLEVIRHCRTTSPDTAIIMVTGHSSIETAVEAMRLGAYDYISKPFELTDLKSTVEQALSNRSKTQSDAATPPQAAIQATTDSTHLLGQSAAIQKIISLVNRVADSSSPVLLEGEFGVGKQLIAKVLHKSSKRRDAAFRVIQCSALPEDLLELELFGKDADHRSIFHRTTGGTIHLAEIHQMPMRIQAKLNTFLEQVSLMDSAPRLIISTTLPLDEAIHAGKFREDLYYKISVVPVQVPPLRNRREDIGVIVESVLAEQAKRAGGVPKKLDAYTLEFLEKYSWPGNISELRNAVERAYALSDSSSIQPEDLPAKITRKPDASVLGTDSVPASAVLPIGSTLESFIRTQEKNFINETLKYNNGSREKTASMLGISIATLYRKMELNAERRTTA